MKKYVSSAAIIPAGIFMILAGGCSDSAGQSLDLPEDLQYVYNAACQTDMLHFHASGEWHVESEIPWITVTASEGVGDISIPLYIQQNDDDTRREGIIMLYAGGRSPVEIRITQEADDNNGVSPVDLPKSSGLGWGYDLKEDYADITGVRGQVFDAARIKILGGEDAVVSEPKTFTNMFYVKGESSESLQKEISGKVTGNADLLVASASVSVEYRNQITEQKDRLYVWCRDIRGVKTAYFDNQIDPLDPDVIEECATYSFRYAVLRNTPEEIVRKFGTHLIIQSCLGGKLDYYFTVSTGLTTEVEKVITTINARILCFSTSQSWVDENVWTEMQKDFQGNFTVRGGGAAGDRLNTELQRNASKGQPLTDSSLFENWYKCFTSAHDADDADLAMVDFEVLPIWYVIEALDPDKADAVEAYVLQRYLR